MQFDYFAILIPEVCTVAGRIAVGVGHVAFEVQHLAAERFVGTEMGKAAVVLFLVEWRAQVFD